MEKVIEDLLRAYLREIELVQGWQEVLKGQKQCIQAGAWNDLQGFIEKSTACMERLGRARQNTHQLEEMLAFVSGEQNSFWERMEILASAVVRELREAWQKLQDLWEKCRELQETNLKLMEQSMIKSIQELEQIQTARRMARAYRQEHRTAGPRCLDRRL